MGSGRGAVHHRLRLACLSGGCLRLARLPAHRPSRPWPRRLAITLWPGSARMPGSPATLREVTSVAPPYARPCAGPGCVSTNRRATQAAAERRSPLRRARAAAFLRSGSPGPPGTPHRRHKHHLPIPCRPELSCRGAANVARRDAQSSSRKSPPHPRLPNPHTDKGPRNRRGKSATRQTSWSRDACSCRTACSSPSTYRRQPAALVCAPPNHHHTHPKVDHSPTTAPLGESRDLLLAAASPKAMQARTRRHGRIGSSAPQWASAQRRAL